jgi:hypothetical protein
VTTDDAAVAVKQGVGEAVHMSVKRPRAGGWVHRSIVAEGVLREQYDGLRPLGPKTTSALVAMIRSVYMLRL